MPVRLVAGSESGGHPFDNVGQQPAQTAGDDRIIDPVPHLSRNLLKSVVAGTAVLRWARVDRANNLEWKQAWKRTMGDLSPLKYAFGISSEKSDRARRGRFPPLKCKT